MENILKIARIISTSDVKDKEKHFEIIYKNFKNKYPQLYTMCCQDNFDISILEYMLSMANNIKKNEISQQEASTQVGQKVLEKFVDVSKLTPRQEGDSNVAFSVNGQAV